MQSSWSGGWREERWRGGGAGKGQDECGVCALIRKYNHARENPAIKVWFSTFPLPSVIKYRKSLPCRHTGKTHSQPVFFSYQSFLFLPCQGDKHETNKFASEKKKKVILAWRSCFIIFLLLFCNSQCGNIR